MSDERSETCDGDVRMIETVKGILVFKSEGLVAGSSGKLKSLGGRVRRSLMQLDSGNSWQIRILGCKRHDVQFHISPAVP